MLELFLKEKALKEQICIYIGRDFLQLTAGIVLFPQSQIRISILNILTFNNNGVIYVQAF